MRGVRPGWNAMPIGSNPREPSSRRSFPMVADARAQWGQLVMRNSINTTLPLRLESSTCLPEGSVMTNSGDLRGTGEIAHAEAPSIRSVTNEAWYCARTMRSTLSPLPVNPFYFVFGGAGRILRAEFVFDHTGKHPRDDVGGEGLHELGRGESWIAEVPGPLQRILQLLILWALAGMGILREPADQVWNRVLVDRKIAVPALLEHLFEIVDQIHQKLFGAFPILREAPDDAATGDLGRGPDAAGPGQRRPQQETAGNVGILLFRAAEETDGIRRTGRL